MKLSSLLFVGLALFQISCSDDPTVTPTPIPDPSGQWVFQSATLVDGNAQTPESADPLVIQNFTTGGPPAELTVPVGDTPLTTQLVAGALAATVCLDPTGASYASFFLEFVADGNLLFSCPLDDPPVADVDMGGWTIAVDADGNYTIFNLTAVLPAGTLAIIIEDFALSADGNSFTGRALNYPMKVDFLEEFSLTNAQFLVADLVLIKKP